MMLQLRQVLKPDQLEQVGVLLADAPFVDGKLTAGMEARRVKNNLELDRGAQRLIAQLNGIVMESLVRHPDYRAGALPLRVAAPYYARYRPGMTYGDHVDDPIMGREGQLYRCDIAITVFLNEPDSYEGGELAINTAFGPSVVKLPAGDAVLYPASSLHRVNQIARGERLVAVTWVQSAVRDPARRELLYDLHLAREILLRERLGSEETAKISRAYTNLIRMWSDI